MAHWDAYFVDAQPTTRLLARDSAEAFVDNVLLVEFPWLDRNDAIQFCRACAEGDNSHARFIVWLIARVAEQGGWSAQAAEAHKAIGGKGTGK